MGMSQVVIACPTPVGRATAAVSGSGPRLREGAEPLHRPSSADPFGRPVVDHTPYLVERELPHLVLDPPAVDRDRPQTRADGRDDAGERRVIDLDPGQLGEDRNSTVLNSPSETCPVTVSSRGRDGDRLGRGRTTGPVG
jgi:hypothetical protein